jgi:hypothetical protein
MVAVGPSCFELIKLFQAEQHFYSWHPVNPDSCQGNGHHGVFLISVRTLNWYHPCGKVVLKSKLIPGVQASSNFQKKPVILGSNWFQACLVVHSFYTLTSSNMVLSGFVFQTIEYWDCPVPKVKKTFGTCGGEHEST